MMMLEAASASLQDKLTERSLGVNEIFVVGVVVADNRAMGVVDIVVVAADVMMVVGAEVAAALVMLARVVLANLVLRE